MTALWKFSEQHRKAQSVPTTAFKESKHDNTKQLMKSSK